MSLLYSVTLFISVICFVRVKSTTETSALASKRSRVRRSSGSDIFCLLVSVIY